MEQPEDRADRGAGDAVAGGPRRDPGDVVDSLLFAYGEYTERRTGDVPRCSCPPVGVAYVFPRGLFPEPPPCDIHGSFVHRLEDFPEL